MAAKHTKKGGRGSKKKKKRLAPAVLVGATVLVIGCVIAGIILLVTSGFHEKVTDKVKQQQYPRSYSDYVNKAAKAYDLDPNLIYAVIRTESSFNPDAGSEAGACGLMQITPETLDTYMHIRGESNEYTYEDLFDPAVNIDYGCYILRDHLDTFGDEECAVAAYNAGPGNVSNWLNDPNISEDGKTLITENIPYDETRDYVKKVEDTKNVYKKLYG